MEKYKKINKQTNKKKCSDMYNYNDDLAWLQRSENAPLSLLCKGRGRWVWNTIYPMRSG